MVGNILAIDGGRTHCRAAVFQGTGWAGYRQGPGLQPGAAPAQVVESLAELTADLLSGGEPVDALSAGLAGMLAGPSRAETAARLSRRLRLRTLVTGDVVAAHAGALGGRAGVVMVAGTGAVALGAAPNGTARADGWGHVLGDVGSGYWIGRRGLDAALRSVDGRGGSPLLARLAEAQLGPLDTLAARLAGSSDRVSTVAGFSEHVGVAAYTGGDAVARRIWAEAADELAATAAACAQQLFTPDEAVAVSWAGGLFDAPEPLLLNPFLDRLRERLPSAAPVRPAGDALTGAASLAGADGPGLLEPLVDTSPAPNHEDRLCAR
jgi:N-acetylglucosamine kinase-like BadF-type ATPase